MDVVVLLATCALSWSARSQVDRAPHVVSSPSGVWSLSIQALAVDGNGAVDLVLTKAGTEVWRRQVELGVRKALVDDSGRVAGFGYTGEGMPELLADARGRTLHLFVLASDGGIVLDETHERGLALYPDGPCNPEVEDVFLQPELGRFVARVPDADPNRAAEEWWGYDLATGAVQFRVRPKLVLAGTESLRVIQAADPVPGTPLVLVQWIFFDSSQDRVRTGSVFQLVDPEWRVAWSFDATRVRARDRDRLSSGGQGASVGERSFELPTAVAGERARFAVKLEDGRWNVLEVERVGGGKGKPSR